MATLEYGSCRAEVQADHRCSSVAAKTVGPEDRLDTPLKLRLVRRGAANSHKRRKQGAQSFTDAETHLRSNLAQHSGPALRLGRFHQDVTDYLGPRDAHIRGGFSAAAMSVGEPRVIDAQRV